MPSFWVEEKDGDAILHNKYGVYSKAELTAQLSEGRLTVEELGSLYDLKPYQILHVLRSLDIDDRTGLNDSRVWDASVSPAMHQIIVGTLMGDAYMQPRSYKVSHSIHQMDYLYHVAEGLGPFLSSVYYKRNKHGDSLEFWTHSHEVFVSYYERFYTKGSRKKFFTGVCVESLDEAGLAYWYMDDGKYDEHGMYLCVGKVTPTEGQMLVAFLKSRFGLEATLQFHNIDKAHYNIYVKAESRTRFLGLIEPRVIPSLSYKLSGDPYPERPTVESIARRHVQLCESVGRPVRFSGNEDIQAIVESACNVGDPKAAYMDAIRDQIKNGGQISRTEMRKMPSDEELVKLFKEGKTDAELARTFGFGRNRIAQVRHRLGIKRKTQRSVDSLVPFPCMDVRLVDTNKVISNEYNPNKVAVPEMSLLIQSIERDGLTQPVVTYYDSSEDKYIVIDGFHRYTVLRDHFKCTKIPVVALEKSINDRMASTIRHNRARGRHQVDLMGHLVTRLHGQGWSDEQIAEHLGMEGEELLRLRQQVGCAEMLAGAEYSQAWEMK